MATLTLQLVTGSGTSSQTVTFSGPDAVRIFNAWKARTDNQAGTQDDFIAYLAARLKAQFRLWVEDAEKVTPTPPVFS